MPHLLHLSANARAIDIFFASLTSVFIEGLADKTFFISAFMSNKYNRFWFFLGAACALFIILGLSCAFGQYIPSLIPQIYIKNILTILFLTMGITTIFHGLRYNKKSSKMKEVEHEVKEMLKANHILEKSYSDIIETSSESSLSTQRSLEIEGQYGDISTTLSTEESQSKPKSDNKSPSKSPKALINMSNEFGNPALFSCESNNPLSLLPSLVSKLEPPNETCKPKETIHLNPKEATYPDSKEITDPSPRETTHPDPKTITHLDSKKATHPNPKEIAHSDPKATHPNPKTARPSLLTTATTTTTATTSPKLIFIQAFSMIFLGEFGDKSQLQALSLSTQVDPLIVFFGAFLGHSAVILLALLGGKYIIKKIPEKICILFGGILYLGLGLLNIMD